MARARNIKPAFFKNYELADAGPIAQMLFAGLWCLADREGRLEDKPRLIKAELFPYYDCDVNGELTVLERLMFVRRYTVDGVGVIEVLNFKKHQTPHNTEKASTLPAYVAPAPLEAAPAVVNGELTVGSPSSNDGKTPDSLIPDSLIPDSLNGQKPLVTGVTDFESFWKLYPRKVSKSDALKSWNKINPDQQLMAKIYEGLTKYHASEDWAREAGKFIKHPATWLNHGCWNDDPKPASNVINLNRHSGFDQADYSDGLDAREDGTHGF